MTVLLRRLGSRRLALTLLLAVAALGALGSVVPQGLEASVYRQRYPQAAEWILGLGLGHYYTGPLFRGLLAALVANLLACGLHRAGEGLRQCGARGKGVARVPLGEGEPWAERLRREGFRVVSPSPLVAVRRSWVFLGFPLTHLSPPLILAGGLWGSLFGFVGTQNVHVGQGTLSFRNWSAGVQAPLPFELRVEDLRIDHYPILLEVAVAGPGAPPAEVRVREGSRIPVAGTPYAVLLGRFDAASGDLTWLVDGPQGRQGPFSKATAAASPVRVAPLAFKDPDVRRAEAVVSLRGADGEPVVRQAVSVNAPLVHGGLRIYLTAWGDDDYGFPYAGFQIVRDPGQPLLWAGALALSLGILLLAFGDGAWAREEAGHLVLGASRGRRRLDSLLREAPPAVP